MTAQGKIKVIKRTDVEKPQPEPTTREVRAEITFLEVLIERYPDRAERFVRKVKMMRVA